MRWALLWGLLIGLVLLPFVLFEAQFNALARRVIDHVGSLAAFPRKGAHGLYDCVHIIPADQD